MELKLVVAGLGYVGLPLVVEACRSGVNVAGYDTSERVVEALMDARSHVDDISDLEVQEVLGLGFRASSDPAIFSSADVIVICVPTPLSEDGGPDLSMVKDVAREIARHLRPGQLVVLESTTYPGTTDEVLVPILEQLGLKVGEDFMCAFSPERIDPGNKSFGLRNTPKIVGGVTPQCTQAAESFYSSIVDEVIVAKGTREAELAKLLENTYRHVNIALVNELVQFSELLGIDLWDSIRCAATKPFGFQPFYPGPGVGGHCIPIDPNYLSHRIRSSLGAPFRFVELAEEINHGMPAYVVRRIQDLLNDSGKAIRGSKVLLLGVTYKANIQDQRESPAVDIAAELLAKGALLSYHDPYVPIWHLPDSTLEAVADSELGNLRGFDLAVLLQHHDAYSGLQDFSGSTPIFDTRGELTGESVVRM